MLTGGCPAPMLKPHWDEAIKFSGLSVRTLLGAHGVRQMANSRYEPAENGMAER